MPRSTAAAPCERALSVLLPCVVMPLATACAEPGARPPPAEPPASPPPASHTEPAPAAEEPAEPMPAAAGTTTRGVTPTVRVVDAGAPPRRRLGHTWTARTEARYRISARTVVTGEGIDAPPAVLASTLVVRIESVTEGRARLAFEGRPLAPAGAPVPAVSGMGTASPSGAIAVDAPPAGAGLAKTAALAMVRPFVELGDPFPDEAVGAGAQWSVQRVVTDQAVPVERTTEYELLEVGEGSVRVRIRRTESPLEVGAPAPATEPTSNAAAGSLAPDEATRGELVITLGRVVPTGVLTSTSRVYLPAEAILESTVTVERE